MLVFHSLLTVVACARPEQPCPSLPVDPRASLVLSSGLGEGTYAVTFATTGPAETCTVTVGPVLPSDAKAIPGAVMGPRTQTSTTCRGLDVANLNLDGTVAVLRVHGTPAAFTVQLAKDGRVLGELQAKPDYTPDRCGFVAPQVPFAVR